MAMTHTFSSVHIVIRSIPQKEIFKTTQELFKCNKCISVMFHGILLIRIICLNQIELEGRSMDTIPSNAPTKLKFFSVKDICAAVRPQS